MSASKLNTSQWPWPLFLNHLPYVDHCFWPWDTWLQDLSHEPGKQCTVALDIPSFTIIHHHSPSFTIIRIIPLTIRITHFEIAASSQKIYRVACKTPSTFPSRGWSNPYPLINIQKAMENHHLEVLKNGKSTISMGQLCNSYVTNYQLVGGAITILKNMSSSLGLGWHPIYDMEVIKAMFETTNQYNGTF